MALGKAICTCERCGAKFEKRKKCYNSADAQSWEVWAVEHFTLCYECWKKERDAREQEKAASYCPITDGSEKQIAWANQIRLKAINELAKLRELMPTKQHSAVDEYANIVFNNPSARFWIDHRGDAEQISRCKNGNFFIDQLKALYRNQEDSNHEQL